MYSINTSILINWVIEKLDTNPIAQSDFDIILIAPSGAVTYITNPTTAWVTPTNTTTGKASYLFTTTTLGKWVVKLVNGISSKYTIFDEILINASCDSLPVTSNLNVNATALPDVHICPLPTINFTASTFFWIALEGITNHVTDLTKLVIIGDRTGTGALDIGIYDVTNDTLTVLDDVVPTTSGNTTSSGLASSSSLGIYVFIQRNAEISGQYLAYWSTDLSIWTACVSPSTAGHGAQTIVYDKNTKLFYWATGVTVFTSSDGKTFFQQKDSLGFNLPWCKAFLGGKVPGFPNRFLIGGTQEELFYTDSTTGIAPITQTLMINNNPARDLITVGNSGLNNIAANNTAIYIMSLRGDVITSTDGISWTVLAESGGTVTNIFLDSVITVDQLHYVNNNLWAFSVATWYRSSDGITWAADSNGPFKSTIMPNPLSMHSFIAYSNINYAYLGYTTNSQQQKIYFSN